MLPVVSSIFEKLVFSQVYGYFMKENIFSDHRSGFRPNLIIQLELPCINLGCIGDPWGL